MRRLLLCLLVLAVSIDTWAETLTSGVWRYTVSAGKATIIGTTQTTGTIQTIPNQLGGVPVATIGPSAFENLSGLTGTLTIPTSVTSIGDLAFSGCSGLTGALRIPASVKSIGGSAFSDCTGFTSLTIAAGVTTIGSGAFSSCTGFTGALTIPATVTSIGDYAFFGCENFNGSLTIPEGVTTIGEATFSRCSKLTGSLRIPTTVTSIGDFAFNRCAGFTGALTIPAKVTTIGSNAFYFCRGFDRALTIPASVEAIGNNAFYACDKLTGSLTLPANLKTIGPLAFAHCMRLTGPLRIPASVTSIGDQAFAQCAGLTSVTFSATTNIQIGGGLTGKGELFDQCGELRYIDASSLPATLFNGVNAAELIGRYVLTNPYTLLYLPAGATPSVAADNMIIGNTCKNFMLYDSGNSGVNGYGQSGYEYGTAIIKSFTATSALYRGKGLEDDGVYTIYLPYNITLPATIEAYALSKYSNKTAIFTKYTGTLQAYTPYLLRRVASSGNLSLDERTMSNVTVAKAPPYLTNPKGGKVTDASTGEWKFLGTTNPIPNATAAANRLYVLETNNTWRPVKTNASGGYVHSLRAFLQAPANYSGAPVAFMLDEEDTPTGLEEIEAEVKKENVDIYTVEGRFVGRNYESLPSGLYIIGGKKVYKF